MEQWRQNPMWLAVVEYYAARWPEAPTEPDEEQDCVYCMLFGVAFALMNEDADWVFPPDTARLEPLVRADVQAARDRLRRDPATRRIVLDRFRDGPVADEVAAGFGMEDPDVPEPLIELRRDFARRGWRD